MSEIVRRWRVLWIGEVVCLLLSFSSIAAFVYLPAVGNAVLGEGSLVFGWILLLLSPLLWLEFALSWVLVGTTGERWIRIGGALVFPLLIAAAATGLYSDPNSFDRLGQPVGWIWLISLAMRCAHAFVVMQAVKSD